MSKINFFNSSKSVSLALVLPVSDSGDKVGGVPGGVNWIVKVSKIEMHAGLLLFSTLLIFAVERGRVISYGLAVAHAGGRADTSVDGWIVPFRVLLFSTKGSLWEVLFLFLEDWKKVVVDVVVEGLIRARHPWWGWWGSGPDVCQAQKYLGFLHFYF